MSIFAGSELDLRESKMEFFKINGDLLMTGFMSERVTHADNLKSRGSVTCFSISSRNRMRSYLRGCIARYRYFGTLTYPDDQTTWLFHKVHFKRFIERLRCSGYFDDDSASLFWFLEFQKRGAPHFHFFCTKRIRIDYLSRTWFECVGSNEPKHLAAGTNIRRWVGSAAGIRRYATKYADKKEQKNVPEMFTDEKSIKGGFSVGRFWGVVGQRGTLSATIKRKRTSSCEQENDIINQLKGYFNETTLKTHTSQWSWSGISFLNIPISSETGHILALFDRYRQLVWQRQGASITATEQRLEISRQKTLHELRVMLYKQAKAKEK